MSRVWNFGAGPSVLPEDVLREVQAELLDYHSSGMSILKHSHRGKDHDAVHNEAIQNVHRLLNVPDDYTVLFLQGGASGQFAMVPLNLLTAGQSADYTLSGVWAAKAIKEAQVVGKVRVVYDVAKDLPARVSPVDAFQLDPAAAYVHITSNETISGAQWKIFPETSAPLVADMSSDILSRPLDVSAFGLIYAGAQKNLGPAGVALVIVRKDLAERVPDTVPRFFRYKTHMKENSLYNTPPCFGIYVIALVTRRLLAQGGLEAVAARNRSKAAKLYAAIDAANGFYRGTAAVDQRSDMNVTFRLPSEALEAQFVQEASAKGMKALKGHRSVGGIRASIYNAFPVAGVEALVQFMKDFEKRCG